MNKPIYLYVKTHNITGLKYFGKTTAKNPCKYIGSGKRWLNHIKIHGKDVSTQIIGLFNDKTLCKSVAIKFSMQNNIVNSDEWANLKEETLDGGWEHINCLPAEKRNELCYSWIDRMSRLDYIEYRKRCARRGERHHMFGKRHSEQTLEKMKNKIVSEETKKKISEAKIGKPMSKETAKKISIANKGVPKSKEHNRKNSEANKGTLTCYDIISNEFIRISVEQYQKQKGIRYFNPNSKIVKNMKSK